MNVGTVNVKCPLDASESGTTSAELEGSFSCVGMQCPPYIRGQGIASGCSSGVILNVGSTCETFCEQGWHLSSSSNVVNCSSSANGTAVLVEPLPECTWYLSAKRENFNHFTFSCFNYVTKVRRIPLTHTTRKSTLE